MELARQLAHSANAEKSSAASSSVISRDSRLRSLDIDDALIVKPHSASFLASTGSPYCFLSELWLLLWDHWLRIDDFDPLSLSFRAIEYGGIHHRSRIHSAASHQYGVCPRNVRRLVFRIGKCGIKAPAAAPNSSIARHIAQFLAVHHGHDRTISDGHQACRLRSKCGATAQQADTENWKKTATRFHS